MNTATDRSLLETAIPVGDREAAHIAAASDIAAVPVDADEIVRLSAVCRFDPHRTIFLEGDPAGAVCEVVDGAVMLYRLLPDGRRQVVELLGPGDIFGVDGGESRRTSAESLTHSRVRLLDRRRAERSDAAQRLVAERMRAQIAAMHAHVVLLGRMSAIERVAGYLLTIAGRAGGGCDGPAVVHLLMTRQEIADYLGLTIETVSRSFSALRRRGVIVLERQDRVRIADPRGLRSLATAM